jgi:predicted O-linked N-acetylglucosamine transferase (SPINDLY family)
VSRMAGGLLHAAGLEALITTGLEAYEELAVALAGDASRRVAIKEDMRRRAPSWRLAPARLARSLEEQLMSLRGLLSLKS